MNASDLLGYGVAAVTGGIGIIVLFGSFFPETIPHQLRLMVGIVFVLLGTYRLSMTRFKEIQRRRRS